MIAHTATPMPASINEQTIHGLSAGMPRISGQKLTFIPVAAHNIGNDSTGTHCGTNTVFDVELSTTSIRLDDVVVEESDTTKVIEEFLRAKQLPLQRMLKRFGQKK